jgi:hypothetical protein
MGPRRFAATLRTNRPRKPSGPAPGTAPGGLLTPRFALAIATECSRMTTFENEAHCRPENATSRNPLILQGVEAGCERLMMLEKSSGGWDRTSDTRLMNAFKRLSYGVRQCPNMFTGKGITASPDSAFVRPFPPLSRLLATVRLQWSVAGFHALTSRCRKDARQKAGFRAENAALHGLVAKRSQEMTTPYPSRPRPAQSWAIPGAFRDGPAQGLQVTSAVCGTVFTATRRRMYCSAKCNMAAYRRRKRETERPNSPPAMA